MTMLNNIFKGAVAIALVIFFSVPTSSAKAAYSSCQCSCNCNCNCNSGTCNKASGNTSNQQVQAAGEKEKTIMAETKRVTEAHAKEDNRKQYSGYKMQLADALEKLCEELWVYSSNQDLEGNQWKLRCCAAGVFA